MALMFLILILGVSGWGYYQLRLSLPLLQGETALSGLNALVVVERDQAGVPTICASHQIDAITALGFLHGQERFFQMDLSRRVPAGRLSELVGKRALDVDRKYRIHRFQALTAAVYSNLPEKQQEILAAYAAGVNQGLGQLRQRPFEYLLLRQQPVAWQPSDSLMVMMAMLCDLQDFDGRRELAYHRLHEQVGPELFHFLIRNHYDSDAALDSTQYPAPEIPDLAMQSRLTTAVGSLPIECTGANEDPDRSFYGSNQWAVTDRLGTNKRAILANDMHLGLRVPATWYQVVIQHALAPDSDETIRLVGVSLPGVPGIVVGSNGSIAWGFTNSYIDTADLIRCRKSVNDQNRYHTAREELEYENFREAIDYPGGSETFEYRWTTWGPVMAETDGEVLALKWIGHDPQAFDFNLWQLVTATDVWRAVHIGQRSGMPHQNMMVVDVDGNIAWTLTGRIPNRQYPATQLPISADLDIAGWHQYLPPDQYPLIDNPSSGRLWTANNRIVGGEWMERLGNGGFDEGFRASRIRERLFEKESFTERDMLAIQLDDRATYLDFWQRLFKEAIDADATCVSRECLQYVDAWNGRASVDSVGYQILTVFRRQVMQFLSSELLATLKIDTAGRIPAGENLFRQLLTERPDAWLPSKYASWGDLMVDAAKASEQELTAAGESLDQARWGRSNRSQIQHPLAASMGPLASWLNMPRVELPGDKMVPRAQGVSFGASQRLVVSPGQEQDGIYHQPGGPSGHPLSPFYRAGFEDWAEGVPSPLLPGPPHYRLQLNPADPH